MCSPGPEARTQKQPRQSRNETGRYKSRPGGGPRWLHVKWPVEPPVVFTKGHANVTASENVNSSKRIFFETEGDLILISVN